MGDTLGQLTSALADRYRIMREIGAGGMATVYLAEDLRHGREVAIKVLRAEVAGALGADRFLREIAVTASLDHPGILPLLDSGNADGVLYYVMPFVRGESLRARLTRERQLPVDDAVDIVRTVGDAHTYAHTLGVVHRDIKPDNILLSGNQARVADFGIARALSEVRGNTLTGTGIVVGSPAYMSPEQAAGDRELDGRSDVYALGCVLYEMLAGQPPFSGPTQESLMRQHLVTPPPEVTQLRPLVPPHIAQALSRAMAKAPADRFQTPAQFIAALRTVSSGENSSPSLATSTTARSTRRTTWIVGAAVIAAAAAGIWLSQRATSSTAANARPLIAVLPFRNIGAASDEYFADGLTEEITSRLTTISSIGTISRTTALSYKGSTKPRREIAKELGVTYVLEGTVRTDRLPDGTGQVRVTPELMKADSDTPLWTDRMTAGLAPGELFKVQAQIAEQVAGALNLTLLARERQAIRRVETVDPEAHNMYLQGRFSLSKASDAGITEAVAFFTKAVTKDSGYARAWAGLADTYARMPFYPRANVPDSVAFGNAAAAATRAIALDSTLSEAHVSLGAVHLGAWRWADAEREFDAALRWDPDNARARWLRTGLMMTLRRYDEAVAEAERAVQLEPASPDMRNTYAHVLASTGRLDEAVASERVALALKPDFIFAHIFLGEIAGIRHDYVTMGREFQFVGPLADIGRALVSMNASAASRLPVIQAIGALQSANPGLDAGRRGWLYAAIGEVDLALTEFETAIRLRSPGGLSALQFPTVRRALGGSPRYAAMLRTAGIAK